MTNKPSPKPFQTLPLLFGVLVFVVMTAILAAISQDVVNHKPLTLLDVQLSNWLHSHASRTLTRAMLAITLFGSTGVASCIAVAFGLCLIWQRSYRWLAVVESAIFGGMLLNKFLKLAFARPRPYFTDPILTLTDFSFPSGHTMTATCVYGMLAWYLCTQTTNRRLRLLIVFAAACLIGLVGFSRMYLGVHYLTDVLGAMAEGLAWLSLCLTVGHSRQQGPWSTR